MKRLLLVWIGTTCDGCGAQMQRVLVPENTDGSVAGKEFPSLCRVCFDTPEIRARVERKLVDSEGADDARTSVTGGPRA